jgi:hypothetical protein
MRLLKRLNTNCCTTCRIFLTPSFTSTHQGQRSTLMLRRPTIKTKPKTSTTTEARPRLSTGGLQQVERPIGQVPPAIEVPNVRYIDAGSKGRW